MAAPRILFNALRVRRFAMAIAVVVISANVLGAGLGQRERSFAEKLRHGPGIANHPVGVRPSANVRIPQGWPLDVAGQISCVTCHKSLPSLDGSSGPNLRGQNGSRPDPARFCTQCHTDQTARTEAGMHWRAMGRAHVMLGNGDEVDGFGSLDAASQRCLECHDGVNAPESINPAGKGHRSVSKGDVQRNHPIGMPYPQGTSARGTTGCRPASMLPAKIRLPGGKVSCVSCHDLYTSTPNRLTVPIEGSQLCFACHQMD